MFVSSHFFIFYHIINPIFPPFSSLYLSLYLLSSFSIFFFLPPIKVVFETNSQYFYSNPTPVYNEVSKSLYMVYTRCAIASKYSDCSVFYAQSNTGLQWNTIEYLYFSLFSSFFFDFPMKFSRSSIGAPRRSSIWYSIGCFK